MTLQSEKAAPRSHLMHPWAVVIIAYWLLLGLSMVVSPWVPDWAPVATLANAEPWVGVLIGATLATGAVLAMLGGRRWRRRTTRYFIERLALVMMAGGWLAWTWATGWHFPDAMAGWGQGLFCATACVLRFVEVEAMERATEQNVARVDGAEHA